MEALSQLRDLAQVNNRRYSADLGAAMERQHISLRDSTKAVGFRTETVGEKIVDRLKKLREKVEENPKLAELTEELKRLQSLAQEIS